MARCLHCTHLRMDVRDVRELPPGHVPAAIVRASEWLDRYLKVSIRRRDARCAKGIQPSLIPIHRVADLEVSGCPAADIDPEADDAAVSSALPHRLSYWVGGRMLPADVVTRIADEITRCSTQDRSRIARMLTDQGVVLP
jgi:hypothetical protein